MLGSTLAAGLRGWVPHLTSLKVSEHSTPHLSWAEPDLATPLLNALPQLGRIEAHPGAGWLAREVCTLLRPHVYVTPCPWSLALACGPRPTQIPSPTGSAAEPADVAAAQEDTSMHGCTAVLHGLYTDLSSFSKQPGAEPGMDAEQLLGVAMKRLPQPCTPDCIQSAALLVPGTSPLHGAGTALCNLTALTLVLSPSTRPTPPTHHHAHPLPSQPAVASLAAAGISAGHGTQLQGLAPTGLAASEFLAPLAQLPALSCLEVLDPHQVRAWFEMLAAPFAMPSNTMF